MEQRGLLIQRPERPRSFPISSSTRQLHAEIELLTSFFFFFFLNPHFSSQVSSPGKQAKFSSTIGLLVLGVVSPPVYSILLAAFKYEWEVSFSPSELPI